jgi:ABC-type transport system involved in multi-copper enzyme maturation permease subunit
MTAAATRFDTGTSEAGELRFGYLLRAEWVKFRTVRGWVVGIVAGALLMIAPGLLTAAGGSTTCQSGPSSPVLSGAACLPRIPLGPGGEAVTDTFSFAHQALAGNGSLTVRVTSLAGRYSTGGVSGGPDPAAGFRPGLQPWSKAGIVIAASDRPGSAYAAMMVTGGHGVRMQFNYTGDLAGAPGRVSAASPRWLRLVRAGDELTGYESGTGTAWTRVGAVRLAGLPTVLQAGMFAASPDHTTVVSQSLDGGTSSGGPSLAAAGFDHVTLSGTPPGASWRHSVVGAGPGDLTAALSGFTRTRGRFTVTGSGDIAPVVAGADASAIGQYLTGGFAGLIAVIIVAVMFVTAEYRRGLIRVTLAATPRRGRVLAAKAIVAAAVAFAAGLVAAAVIIPVAGRLAHDKGAYVLPVTPLAELQVIAGTAALLAVAAVLAVAIAAALRRSAAAVTAGIVLIVLPYILGTTSVLPTGAEQWLLRLTPAAAVAVQSTTPQYPQVTAGYTPSAGYFPLAPWAGLAVLCGYAAVALGLAWWLLRRRDA